MKRVFVMWSLVAVAIAAALPVFVAAADGFPPPPPTTYYGTIAGATSGQGVIAIVTDGSSSATCGAGLVLSDTAAGIVYVIDVQADGQTPGCGKAGRNITFSLTPTDATSGGKLSVSSTAWAPPGPPVVANLTFGPAIPRKANLPLVAKDGVY